MPYEGEYASKISHMEFLQNPEVRAFLDECEYLTPPSDEECEALAARFGEPPSIEDVKLPPCVIAVDGSYYESSLDEKLPSTKIGYIKLGAILIQLSEFDHLKIGRFVDPFRVAKLQKGNTAFTFFVPSANIRWGDQKAVRESFRAILDKQFRDEKTWFDKSDSRTSLRTTLFHLASHRPGEMFTGDST